MSKTLLAAALLALAMSSAAPPALAGQVLLTHAKALNGGIPGDAPGYPITISKSGSYKLDGNLKPPAGKHGIEVTAHDVTIDFAGFTLRGNNAARTGIWGNKHSLTVKNGTISSFTEHGIHGTGSFWTIDDMRVAENQESGVFAEGGSWTIANSQIVSNRLEGIVVLDDGPILIRNNVVSGNGFAGIYADRAHIEGNMVADNGHAEYTSGIILTIGTVLGNTVVDNASYGVSGSGFGLGNNTFSGNNGTGDEVLGGVPLHPNVCEGAAC